MEHFMFEVKRVGKIDFSGQMKINRILYECGKDMANKYDLHHWDNSGFKNFIIISLCEVKNRVFLVTENKNPVATFQIRIEDSSLHFEKLACSPNNSGKGIGSHCMNYIEEIAREANCKKICMEVYSSSQHAIEFYKHRGYVVSGEIKTLKYDELKMEKVLQ